MPNPMPSDELARLQTLLVAKGFLPGPESSAVDGDWGPATKSALDKLLASVWSPPAPATPRPLSGPNPLRITGLAPEYQWLARMGDNLPRTIWVALQEYGLHELTGSANNPTILKWAAETGLQAVYTADSIPWCGLFAALVCKRAGKVAPKDPLWALNWGKFGVDVGQAGLGDILVFTREGGGHVGFYVGEDGTAYHVLGGNTSDEVKIARIDKKRLYRARRPAYTNPPASVRPFVLASNGALSTNEA